MSENMVSLIETNWEDFQKDNFTSAEIGANEIRSELVRIRRAKSVSQKALSQSSGVGYSTISKYESARIDTTITILLKMLNSLGKTLTIIDIEDEENVSL